MEGARYVPLPLFLLQYVHSDFRVTARCSICLGIYQRFIKGETKEEILNLFYVLPKLTEEEFTNCLSIGEEVNKRVLEKKEPTPHVKLSMLLEYRDRHKTTEQLDEFCCYVSIRSIVPEEYPCWKTNNEFIFQRMLGFKSEIPEEQPEHIKLFRERYCNKKGVLSSHKFNRLIRQLEANWRVRKLSQKELGVNMRGFYIGIYKDNPKKSFKAMYEFATRKKRKQNQVQKDKMDAIRGFKNNDF